MKILYLSDEFPPRTLGGAGIIAAQEARAFAAHGHEVLVFTITNKKSEVGEISEGPYRIFQAYSSYPLFLRPYLSRYNPLVIGTLKRVLRDFSPDIVHAHNIHLHISYAALKIAKKSGAKVFLTLHDLMTVAKGKVGPLEMASHGATASAGSLRRYLSYCNKLFAVSDAINHFLSQSGIDNIVTLHNGLDVNEWQPDEARVKELREQYKLEGKKVLLFSGRLSGAKGIYTAIDALALEKERVDIRLLIVGRNDSSAAKKIVSYAEEKKVYNNIDFTGWIDHAMMKNVNALADIVLVLSRYIDPFPTVNLEAMAAGRPVIGTKYGGTPEIVVHKQTGFVVDPYDTSDVALRIRELLQNPELAKKMGEAAYQRVKESFSLNQHINALISWYNA